MNQMATQLKNQMIQQPQTFATNALKSGYFKDKPMFVNALEAVQSGNEDKAKEIVENLCRMHKVSPDDAMRQYQSYYGLNQ